MVWDATWRPFGEEDGITGTATNSQRFPGQYKDAETGLHYNYFRDYDPTTGRYLQSDPIGLDGGLNTYSYAIDNPTNYTDSYGLSAEYGLCFLECLRDNGNPIERWLDKAVNGGYAAGVAGQFGNAVGNIAAGNTGRVGVGGTRPHATTWQHKVGSRLGPTASRVGRAAGRAAVAVTLFDGAWNYGAALGCSIRCAVEKKAPEMCPLEQ